MCPVLYCILYTVCVVQYAVKPNIWPCLKLTIVFSLKNFLLSAQPSLFSTQEEKQTFLFSFHLVQGQDLIMSIQIYLKYKYTYENAGFCILCIDDYKI